MNARELITLVEDFIEYYVNSPANQEMHLGCECGCGGDSFTSETWEEAHRAGDEAREKLENFCEAYNITFDYD